MVMRSRGVRSLAGIACAALVAGLAAGCSPVIQQHGYAPLPEQLAEIRPGLDTRQTVMRKIGRPASSGIFTDQGWYYVASKVERLTYHAPKVVDRRVVAVTFDPNDVVASVDEYGLEDGRIIDLATETTPTYGRQLTIIEQAFGNIGVITGSVFGDEEGARPYTE
jgi:outer membrane protein assembly factor BamE (lipoprotein component of BamABCDE complex)